MHEDLKVLVSILGLLLSGLIGGLTVWLTLRKRIDEDSLARATRRTSALQLLSDEEYTLEQVRDECIAMDTLFELRDDDLGGHRQHLRSEISRVISESNTLLNEVRKRRTDVEASLPTLRPTELEAVIALAYHGKKRAEAQLTRTRLSRTDILRAYGVYPSAAAPKSGA